MNWKVEGVGYYSCSTSLGTLTIEDSRVFGYSYESEFPYLVRAPWYGKDSYTHRTLDDAKRAAENSYRTQLELNQEAEVQSNMTKNANHDLVKARLLEGFYGRKYSPTEFGTWRITGEDPNPDMGGPHHEPHLAIVTGLYQDVVEKALVLPGFFGWGAGGSIHKESTIQLEAERADSFLVSKVTVFAVLNYRNRYVRGYIRREDAERAASRSGQEVVERVVLLTSDSQAYLLLLNDPSTIDIVQPDPKVLRNEVLKRSALSKLTEEERVALGVK
jgi:hypothetical protein